jgi:hypothetical protein|tara:strand:+ start:865 stop:1002 length:138 start_codon:yes stop_codon:yes gene_type:complete
MIKKREKQCPPLMFSCGLAAKVFDTSWRYQDNSALEKEAGKFAIS